MDTSGTLVNEQFLAQVQRLIEWESLREHTRRIADRAQADAHVQALKLGMIARWYGIGNGDLSGAIGDRISFRRFVGIPIDDAAEDARVVNLYLQLSEKAATEMQELMHAVESQLMSKGFGIRSGVWMEAAVVPVARHEADQAVDLAKTMFFPPGEGKRFDDTGDSLVARGGVQAGSIPVSPVFATPQLTPPPSVVAQLRLSVELPWGETLELKERTGIGRDFNFCVFAAKIQTYRHVSRKHLELTPCGAGIWVRDMHSHNGTFVNDEEIPRGQAYLVEADARLRCGPNFVVLLSVCQQD